MGMPPNCEYWWSTKQPQVTDLRWASSDLVTSERYWAGFQVTKLFHNATVSHCDHFCCYICICCLKLHQADYKVEEFFWFFLTSIWWGSTQLQSIYYLRRILISRPPRVFRRFKRRSCIFLSQYYAVLKMTDAIRFQDNMDDISQRKFSMKIIIFSFKFLLTLFPIVLLIIIYLQFR